MIHCWEAKPDSRWYPWLKEELGKRGFKVYVPAMPNTMHPRQGAWVRKLADLVGKPDKDCYFVGHSVGAITILRYLESLRAGQKVGGAVFVAGFASNLAYHDLETFFSKPIDWKRIKSHCTDFIAIASDNDPFVSTHYATDIFKNNLGATPIIEHMKGHFSIKPPIERLPSTLSAVLKLSKR